MELDQDLNTENTDRPLTEKEFLRWRIARDLNKSLETFRNKDIGLRLIAEKTGLSEKTLKRILSENSDPHANTIRGFYQYFFKLVDIDKSEEEDYIKIRKIVDHETLNFSNKKSDDDLVKVMASDPIFRQIFIYSRTGLVLRTEIERQFGMYGAKIIDLMLKRDVLLEVDKGVYKEGPVSINKNGEIIKKVIVELIEANLDAEALNERGLNSAFYAVEGINSKCKDALLEKIDLLKKEIFSMLSDPESKGDERIFIALAMDHIQINGNDNQSGKGH